MSKEVKQFIARAEACGFEVRRTQPGEPYYNANATYRLSRRGFLPTFVGSRREAEAWLGRSAP